MNILNRNKTAAEVARDKFIKQFRDSVLKAINVPHEVPVKTKHVRILLLGIHKAKSPELYWFCIGALPLQGQQVICWKFCHVTHSILRNGVHPQVVKGTQQYKSRILELGKVWQNVSTTYGALNAGYCYLLYHRIDLSLKYKQLLSTLELSKGVEIYDLANRQPQEYFLLSIDLFELMEAILKFVKRVLNQVGATSGLSNSPVTQCKIAPFVLCIQDTAPLYDYLVALLYEMHQRLDSEALLDHRKQFQHVHERLKFFYDKCNTMLYIRNLISIPTLPAQEPQFPMRNVTDAALSAKSIEAGQQQGPVVNPSPPTQVRLVDVVGLHEQKDENYESIEQSTDARYITQSSINDDLEAFLNSDFGAGDQTANANQFSSSSANTQSGEQRMTSRPSMNVFSTPRSESFNQQFNQFADFDSAFQPASGTNDSASQPSKALALIDDNRFDMVDCGASAGAGRNLSSSGGVSEESGLLREKIATAIEQIAARDQLIEQVTAEKEHLIERHESQLLSASEAQDELIRQLTESRQTIAALEAERATKEATGAESQSAKFTKLRDLHQKLVNDHAALLRSHANLTKRLKALEQEQGGEKADANAKKFELNELKYKFFCMILNDFQHFSNQHDIAQKSTNANAAGGNIDGSVSGIASVGGSEVDVVVMATELCKSVGELQMILTTNMPPFLSSSTDVISTHEQDIIWLRRLYGALQSTLAMAMSVKVALNTIVYPRSTSLEDVDEMRSLWSHLMTFIGAAVRTLLAIPPDGQSEQAAHYSSGKVSVGKAKQSADAIVEFLQRTCRRDKLPEQTATAADNDATSTATDEIDAQMMAMSEVVSAAIEKLSALVVERSDNDSSNDDGGVGNEQRLAAWNLSTTDKEIIDACARLMEAIFQLSKAARRLQHDVVTAAGGVTHVKEFYAKNSGWSQGLISAAQSIAFVASSLVSACDAAFAGRDRSGGTSPRALDEISVLGQEMAAAVVRLVVTARVKAPESARRPTTTTAAGGDTEKSQQGSLGAVEEASSAVSAAAASLLATVKAVVQRVEERAVNESLDNIAHMKLHTTKRLEIESQVRCLELEQQLSQERIRLAELRRRHYHLAGEDESLENPDGVGGGNATNGGGSNGRTGRPSSGVIRFSRPNHVSDSDA